MSIALADTFSHLKFVVQDRTRVVEEGQKVHATFYGI